MSRFFPADYRVILPAADPVQRREADGPVRIAFVDVEERGALRLFLRALRRIDPALDWRATVVSERGPSSSTPLRSELRERIRFDDGPADELLAGADVVVLASDGATPAPGLLLRALGRRRGAGRRQPDGLRGAAGRGRARAALRAGREPGARRPARARARRRRPCATSCATPPAALRDRLSWERVADELEEVYRGLVGAAPPRRGRPGGPQPALATAADRRRPAHAHRPLARLRDAGRGAARHGARPGPRRDRGHRPQRDLRRARGGREGGAVRDQGDRRRGGQDRRARARSSACSSRRRSRAG